MTQGLSAADVEWLLTPAGRALRAAAAAALTRAQAGAAAGHGRVDPLAVTAHLRRDNPDVPGDLIALALTQAELAAGARSRLGPAADAMVLTRDGVEQATRRVVADRRAARLAAAGATTVADLGCGLGGDALAFTRAGLDVHAVELDPATAAAARANARAADADRRLRVWQGDVTDPDLLAIVLAGCDAGFVDPARRTPGAPTAIAGGRTAAERDPERWSPPWSWVLALADRLPRTCAKVAPGIRRDLPPPGAEVEWVSVDGQLVEAAVWFPALAEPGVRRRATVLRRDRAADLVSAAGDESGAPPTGPIGAFVVEPDDAVIRAGLVADLAREVDGRLLHPTLAWITTDARPATPVGRTWAVLDVLTDDPRALRAALRERGIGRVTVKTRGVQTTPERLSQALRLDGRGAAGVLMVTRTTAGGVALLVEPVREPPG